MCLQVERTARRLSNGEQIVRWVLNRAPEIGDKITVQDSRYELLDDFPLLRTWKSNCAVCGEAFKFITSGRQFRPEANCAKHRRQQC